MSMELKLSSQDKAILKRLTTALDKVAKELGKDKRQAPKSPSRLSEPYTEDWKDGYTTGMADAEKIATQIPRTVTLSAEEVKGLAEEVEPYLVPGVSCKCHDEDCPAEHG